MKDNYLTEILNALSGKESAVELDLEGIKLGSEHFKIGLEGKVRLRLIHLQESKYKKSE